MNRPHLILATLAAAGPMATFTPVQVQKIFFLLDRRAGSALGGPHFNFAPYDYGPFDQRVYHELSELERSGFVKVDSGGRYKTYALSEDGYAFGSTELAAIDAPIQEFVRQTVEWVRRLRFDQLVAAIYREYPEMKANSIFNLP
jgi:uncharacterized protein YwgA